MESKGEIRLNEAVLGKIAFHIQALHMCFVMSEEHRQGILTDKQYNEWLVAQNEIIQSIIKEDVTKQERW